MFKVYIAVIYNICKRIEKEHMLVLNAVSKTLKAENKKGKL